MAEGFLPVSRADMEEQGIKQLPELPFKAVYGLYHAFRRVVFYQDHDPHAGSALCENQQRLL